jgi:hypothetical protein
MAESVDCPLQPVPPAQRLTVIDMAACVESAHDTRRQGHSPEHCLLVRSDSCYGAWRVRWWCGTGRYPKEQHAFGVVIRSAIAESGLIECPKSLNGKNWAKTLTDGAVLEELESVLRDTDFRRPWGNAPPHSLSRTECGSARSPDLNPIEHS